MQKRKNAKPLDYTKNSKQKIYSYLYEATIRPCPTFERILSSVGRILPDFPRAFHANTSERPSWSPADF